MMSDFDLLLQSALKMRSDLKEQLIATNDYDLAIWYDKACAEVDRLMNLIP